MLKPYKWYFLLVFLFAGAIFGQTYKMTGKVTSFDTGEALIGANVYVKNLSIGAATDMDGNYEFEVPAGTHTIVCSYIGFETQEEMVTVRNNTELHFRLNDFEFSLSVTVLADRAKERETPVAFTDVDKRQMETQLGSQDIPLILNTTPSVYSTMQGGGSGDARFNVRGFDQRNIAIMINGVPVNDMENGWVYWSNWDGVADATSSLQMQRGLSAVNLATPSVGGTMNIITDPTQQNMGFKFKQELGNDGFLKSTLFGHTGLINKQFAFSAGAVRKVGDGVMDKTWTDAWAYYFGAAWNVDDDNRLELYALGAPQRHGQNLYKQNIAVYDQDYAKDLDGYDVAAFGKYNEVGRTFNQNWSPVSSSYTGEQYWNTGSDERYDETFLNERENYYHKPQVNLNWYSNLSKKLSLYTTVYYSGGEGGGSGTYGSIINQPRVPGNAWYASAPYYVDWDATIARNDTSSTGSLGILRNSVNNQWTIGGLVKAYLKATKNFKASVGLDIRTAEIEHYREVRDLLGGNYYYYSGNDFDSPGQYQKGLGDKIAYDFTNNVNWIGGYIQGEYSKDKFTVYGTVGYSTIKYKHTNHFKMAADGGETVVESDNIGGYQVKGGASYRATDNVTVYANAGFVSKVPIFDNVIDDQTSFKNEDYTNEKFTSFEAGINFVPAHRHYFARLNGYYTQWNDRTTKYEDYQYNTDEINMFLSGVDATHIGVEFEAGYQPFRYGRFDASASIGSWEYTDDVKGTAKVPGSGVSEEVFIAIKDLKVGDAPQTQFALSGTAYPVDGMMLQVVFKYFTSHYAAFNPFDRIVYTGEEADRTKSWEVPGYGLLDLHFAYDLPFNMKGVKATLFGHVFNLLDTIYVQDATDNSQYNAWDNDHDADDAEVYLGLPRTFNLGISIQY